MNSVYASDPYGEIHGGIAARQGPRLLPPGPSAPPQQEHSSATQTALVVGAGDNLGAAIARRFAREGLHVLATRRRGDLSALVASIEAAGGRATAVYSDARDEQAVRALVAQAERIGPLAACIFNVGGNVRFPIAETTARFTAGVGDAPLAGFLVGRKPPALIRQRGQGTILFTGASARPARKRWFCRIRRRKTRAAGAGASMARELGPKAYMWPMSSSTA